MFCAYFYPQYSLLSIIGLNVWLWISSKVFFKRHTFYSIICKYVLRYILCMLCVSYIPNYLFFKPLPCTFHHVVGKINLSIYLYLKFVNSTFECFNALKIFVNWWNLISVIWPVFHFGNFESNTYWLYLLLCGIPLHYEML
jgi:hypothetical protein